jgi:hypothetical protein
MHVTPASHSAIVPVGGTARMLCLTELGWGPSLLVLATPPQSDISTMGNRLGAPGVTRPNVAIED